jgi:hypothetical protein
MIDIEFILQAMLVIAGACIMVSAGLVLATAWYLAQARRLWRQARRGPYVARDYDGRPIRERL